MNIILLGPPGAGKGTQADRIAQDYKLAKISTGDILRLASQDDTERGRALAQLMSQGALVPDALIIELIGERIKAIDCAEGFLLDGFPRTLAQAQALAAAEVKIDFIIEIKCRDALIMERLTGRWVHPASGRSYHTRYAPPKCAYRDDISNEALVQRTDDTPPVVAKRLQIFHEQTAPVSAWYQAKLGELGSRYLAVDGEASLQTVWEMIKTGLDSVV